MTLLKELKEVVRDTTLFIVIGLPPILELGGIKVFPTINEIESQFIPGVVIGLLIFTILAVATIIQNDSTDPKTEAQREAYQEYKEGGKI